MAKNSYNPYYDVNQIYNYKGQYDKAKNSGDSQLAQQIASFAQQNYNNLRSNGYEDVAKSLGDVGYSGAKKIRDKYAMEGKVAIRPYLYNSKLKTKYGMSDADIDKALSFNETTGEVSLGGMNLGSPYSNVDGTTYWDSASLDKGIEDYISHSGVTPSKTELINQNNAGVLDKTNALYDLQMSDHKDLSGKYNELYDKAMYENPFETPTGQSIMNEYKLKGAQAGENAKAEGGASNSGNIDSYAAANALRQQAAMTSKGQQMAIAAQTEAINNVRGILGDIGGSQQNSYAGMQKTIGLQQSEGSRLFDEQQTEKLNDHSINYDIANVSGVIPSAWMTSVNPYFNDDGTLKNENLDYGIEIEKVDEKLKNTEDPVERNRLLNERNYLYAARQYKLDPNNYGGKYAKPEYVNKQFEGGGYSPMRTLGAQQTEYNYDLGLGTNATNDKAVEYSHEEAMGANATAEKQMALDAVITMAGAGIPPSKELLSEAGYGDMTPDEFMTSFKNSRESFISDEKRAQAVDELYNAVATGMPITQPMLDAAGYTDMTPETFVSLYHTNLGNIYETQKKNPEFIKSGSPGNGSGSTPKEKISQSLKEKIIKNIDNGGEGLTTLLDTIDWDKYNAEDAYNFIMNNWGDDAEIVAATNNYFNVDAYDEGNVSARAKLIADGINAKYHTITNGETYVPLSRASDGTYKVNGNQKEIIQAVDDDDKLSDSEKLAVLDMFGITQDDLEKYNK